MIHVRFTTKDSQLSSIVPLVIFIEKANAGWFAAFRDDLIAELNTVLCDVMEDIYASHEAAEGKQQIINRLPCKLAIAGYCTAKRSQYEVVTIDTVGNNNTVESIVPFQLRVWLYPPDAEALDALPIFL